MTAVCESDGQWTPNPGGVTCSPSPTQTFTPTQTSTPSSEHMMYTMGVMLSCTINLRASFLSVKQSTRDVVNVLV